MYFHSAAQHVNMEKKDIIDIWTNFCEEIDGIKDKSVSINNIVVRCECDPKPEDMEIYKNTTCTHSQRSQFRPKDDFSAFNLSPYNDAKKAKALIYGTGKIVIVGLFSPGEVRTIIPILQSYLSTQNNGHLCTISNIKVVNIVPSGKLYRHVDLKRFFLENTLKVTYNPDFPGARITIHKKSTGKKRIKDTITVFKRGSFICPGQKTIRGVNQVIREFKTLISKYCGAHILPEDNEDEENELDAIADEYAMDF